MTTALPPRAANVALRSLAAYARVEPVDLVAVDGAPSSGLYYLPVSRAPRVGVHLMHPRTDQSRNYNIGPLVKAGFAVLGRSGRSVNNDADTLHEDLLLDVAAGVRFLRERGCQSVVLLGNSGGATLAALYQSQAEADPAARIGREQSVSAVDLRQADLPRADGLVSIGGHTGQANTLMKMIDASVVDESDPLSIDPNLDMYDPRNGFALPVKNTRYDPMFVAAVREAQRQRVARLDRFARATLAGSTQARSISRSFPADQADDTVRLCMERRGATRRYMLIYRTIADPAMLDLTIEPDDRPSGGFDSHPRPDIQNYAQGGFAHYMTPRAWLSTWSGLSSNATSVQRLKEVTVPALFVHYAADIFTRLSELGEMEAACGAADKTVTIIRHTDHYGRRVAPDGSLGERVLDGTRAVRDWMQERFPA